MLFIVLFIAVCRAADSSSSAAETGFCQQKQYYDHTTKACTSVDDKCEDGQADPFYGCRKCKKAIPDNGVSEVKHYAFKGKCKPCYCKDDSKCHDEIGCSECDDGYVMYQNVSYDGTYEFSCLDVSKYEPIEDDRKELDWKMYYTEKYCTKWDGKGCSQCSNNTYWTNGFCMENKNCAFFDESEKVFSKNGWKCVNCSASGETKSYYLNDVNVCEECDPHCVDCEINGGNCNECEDGYVPDLSHNIHKRCYKCDPNCASDSCVYDANKKHHMKCTKCRPGYFNVNNERCIRCPAGCAKEGNCADNRGCINCDEPKVDFLIPDMYLSEDGKTSGFHFNLSGIHIGWCVPHQAECPLVNRTINGCLGCDKGYVLDTVTYKFNGSEFKTGFCSGASSLLVVFLIALLLLAL